VSSEHPVGIVNW